MMKVRIQFAKGGALRFVGHLDFLRLFGQMLRRSGLPLAFSQGFNPHILLGFALPLPLGMASTHDYADLVLTKQICLREAAVRLQHCAPAGLDILRLTENAGRSSAAVTAAADYTLTGEIITDLLAEKEWIIAKKTKSGTKNTDIRPDIFDIKKIPAPQGQGVCTQGDGILLRLAAGSDRFLNPVTVAQIVTNRDVTPAEITRTELYEGVGEAFMPLGIKTGGKNTGSC